MPTKLLISHQITGHNFEVEMVSEEMRIGRAPERNDVVLNDERVSRQHAVVRKVGRSNVLADLDSVNGTFVNGLRIKERVLSNLDSVSIGNYTLVYQEQESLPSIEYDDKRMAAVVLRDPEQITLSSPQEAVSPDDASLRSLWEEMETLRKKAETLSRLYELSRVLSSVFSLKDIFKKVGEMLFRTTQADRYVVLLKNAESNELKPFATELRDSNEIIPPGHSISISKTVLDRVQSERVSLLSYDAQADERLKQSRSIMMQQVRSVMCAPLLGSSGVLGVIYVDSQQLMKGFTAEDLDMLNALAAQASMAVENAITHDQLVKEALARAAYGRFMPRHVVDQILANPRALSLGGTNQAVTVLFSDLRGFTTMAEGLAPEKVVQVLNEYFSDMTPIVFGYRGLLDKYIGDAVMAIFGAPYATEDSAANAVGAAIAMQRRMLKLNDELKEAGLPELAMGVGINTGTVTVGYIGSEQRTDYTVIGDAVNLASRLERQAGPWQILIGADTLEAIGDRYQVEPFGEIKLKGKSAPVRVYEVIWQPETDPTRTTRG
jgi:adenylate cyclase